MIDFNAALMVNQFNSFFASFIHVRRCLIVLINRSTKPIAPLSFARTGISDIRFCTKNFYLIPYEAASLIYS